MRDPKSIGADLNAWLKRRGLTEAALVDKISKENNGLKISQSWLSRILAGKFRRLTPKIRGAVEYASIPVFEASKPNQQGAKLIKKAVAHVWDGSLSHANLIAKLIKVADGVEQLENQSGTGGRRSESSARR